jgi:hypothetical protein
MLIKVRVSSVRTGLRILLLSDLSGQLHGGFGVTTWAQADVLRPVAWLPVCACHPHGR